MSPGLKVIQMILHPKWNKLLESVGKYKVTHHDYVPKKQDSYILKVVK